MLNLLVVRRETGEIEKKPYRIAYYIPIRNGHIYATFGETWGHGSELGPAKEKMGVEERRYISPLLEQGGFSEPPTGPPTLTGKNMTEQRNTLIKKNHRVEIPIQVT